MTNYTLNDTLATYITGCADNVINKHFIAVRTEEVRNIVIYKDFSLPQIYEQTLYQSTAPTSKHNNVMFAGDHDNYTKYCGVFGKLHISETANEMLPIVYKFAKSSYKSWCLYLLPHVIWKFYQLFESRHKAYEKFVAADKKLQKSLLKEYMMYAHSDRTANGIKTYRINMFPCQLSSKIELIKRDEIGETIIDIIVYFDMNNNRIPVKLDDSFVNADYKTIYNIVNFAIDTLATIETDKSSLSNYLDRDA